MNETLLLSTSILFIASKKCIKNNLAYKVHVAVMVVPNNKRLK